MAQVHFADVPRHVGRGKGDIQPCGHALFVDLVNIVHPDRHPDTFVSLFVSVLLEGGRVRTAAATSLRSLAKKNLAFARPNRSKSRRRSPIPTLPPAPLLEPREAGSDVGHVQYRGESFRFHK